MAEEKKSNKQITIQNLAKLCLQLEVSDAFKGNVYLISNMRDLVLKIADFYDDEQSQQKKDELELLYENPVSFILKNYSKHFNKKTIKRISNVNKSLSELEFIHARDGRRGVSLRKPYYSDESKPRRSRNITLSDLIKIRGYLKNHIGKVFTWYVKTYDIPIEEVNLPKIEVEEIEQAGVEVGHKTR